MNSTTYYYLLESKCLPTELCLPFSYFQFNVPKHVIQFQFQHPLLLFYCIASVIVLHAYTKGTTQDLISSPPIPYTIFFGPVILLTKLSKSIGRNLSIRVQKFFANRFSIMYVHVSQCMYMFMTGRHN